jgi:hypothetical protein
MASFNLLGCHCPNPHSRSRCRDGRHSIRGEGRSRTNGLGLLALTVFPTEFSKMDDLGHNMEAIDAAENGLPRSFMMPRCASSAEISRSDRCPPLGRRRRS